MEASAKPASHAAAVLIQRRVHGSRGASRLRAQRQAATTIQRLVRGRMTRRAVERVRLVQRVRLESVRREVAAYSSSLSTLPPWLGWWGAITKAGKKEDRFDV